MYIYQGKIAEGLELLRQLRADVIGENNAVATPPGTGGRIRPRLPRPTGEHPPSISPASKTSSGFLHNRIFKAAAKYQLYGLEAGCAAMLSARELKILVLAAEGLKRDKIAGRLGISAGTVQPHLYNVHLKLEVGGKTVTVKKGKKYTYRKYLFSSV